MVNNLSIIVLIVVLFAAFIFLIQLEDDKTCNCVITWKHHVIKLTIGFVIATLLILMFSNELDLNNKDILEIISWFLIIFSVGIFYFYINELNKTKCSCLAEKPILNQILILLSNILPICLVFIIFMLSKNDKIMNSVKILTDQFIKILTTIIIGIIYLMIVIADSKSNSRNQKNIYIY